MAWAAGQPHTAPKQITNSVLFVKSVLTMFAPCA
jgi:hypothetical protein